MKTIARKKNYLSVALVLILLCAFIAGIGLSAAKAEATETQQTIRIAHISDMHVMIEEYCNVYSGKYIAETKVTKLLEETPRIAEAVFDDIYKMNENAPMYVFITGDITSNGEYENHVWLSKLYKDFTQKMRSRTDYDFSGFQIFLSPGNHDLYNCKAKSFMPTTEELDACANDAERMTLLENYKPRSVASITSKQFMDLYSDFGYCSCPDRKNGHHLSTCGMVDGCSLEYFFESEYWYDNATSRDGAGLEVRNPSDKTLDAFKNSDKDYNVLNPDARFGACSYIARMGDFDVVTFDANTRGYKYEKWQSEGDAAVRSCGGWHESTGGMISEDQLRWAITSVKNDVDDGKAIFALGHTNFLPHFDSEDEVISLFTYDNWEQASYTLADNGIRYVFSGHQHASDITSYVTQNGNVLYDMEACSLASYGCAWRTMDLKRTISSDGKITEDFESLTHNLNYSPFEYGVYKLTSDVTIPAEQDPYNIIPLAHPNGYMTLEKKVTADKKTGDTIGIADYLAAQMYNMASSLKYGMPGEYVGEKIYGLLDGLTEKLSSLPYTQGIVSALVDGLPSVDLCKFSFDGNAYSVGQTPTAGYDLADFTKDLAEYLMQYDFSGAEKKGLTLAKAFMVIYGGHLSGAHSDVMDEEIKPLIDMLKSGRFVSGVIGLLEDSLLPQLEILLDVPIRFDAATPALTGAGFDLVPALTTVTPSGFVDIAVETLVERKIIFAHTIDGYSSLRLLLSDLNEVLTDVLVTPKNQIKNENIADIAGLLRGVLNFAIDEKYIDMAREYLGRVTSGETIRSVVDEELVNKYVTDAFCKNLGIYGANILIDMDVDETDDGSAWIEGGDRYTRFPVRNYKHVLTVKNEDGTVAFGGHTYQSGTRLAVTPSAENGLLPNLISVSFGNDVYTEKNLCWFTAEQVDIFNKVDGKYVYALPDSYIRYSLSPDMTDAVTVKATGENVDKVLPTIDLGILFINMNHAHKIYNRYSVNLTGLEKGATYYYQLGKEGAWTKVFRFATASDGEFTFMAITDIQGSVEENYIESNRFMTKAMEFFGNAPAFILSGGDNVDNGKSIYQYTWLLNDQQEIWANNTLVSAVGNHEKEDHSLDGIIALPSSATITGDTGYYYSYDYNNAHIIVLNTNDLNENNYLSYAQQQWLTDDLTADSENEKTNWTIVLLHKGPYTAGSHAFDNDVKTLRKQLPAIFSEYGVDLVLQGHDHTYSVSNFIDVGVEDVEIAPFTNKTFYKQSGVLYVNLGTMGDKFYDYLYSDQVSLAERDGVSAELSPYFTSDKKLELTETPVFAKITVNNDNLIVKTYTFINGEIVPVDDFTLSHLDEPKGLSVGAIVGIVIGSAAGAALIAVGVIFIIKKKRGKK